MSGKGNKTATARSNERNYKLFAIEYHSNSLHSIRDVFATCVKSGLRRNVFIIDLDSEMKKRPSTPVPDGRQLRKSMARNTGPSLLNTTLEAIARCRRTYDEIARKIAAEASFDLLTYWLNNLTVMVAMANNDGAAATAPAGKTRPSQTARTAAGKRASKVTSATLRKSMAVVERAFTCPSLLARQHNRTGQPPIIGKRKYIADEPLNSKLFIILMGSQLSQQFYLDLLSHGEPLQAITHFMPEPCTYDLLLPYPARQREVDQVLEELQTVTYNIRQSTLTKPVGMLHQRLPVMSRCSAERLSDEIYAQLCWWHFDVDILRRHYDEYYVQPFNIRNVAMPATGVDLHHLYETAASLGMQGHYLTLPLPAVAADTANVVVYLNSLLSTFGEPPHVLTPLDLELLTAPPSRSTYGVHDAALRAFHIHYKNAFNSITMFYQMRRLVVERPNTLLHQLVAHADQHLFRNVYLTCLEYNMLRKYLVCPYAQDEVVVCRFDRCSRPRCPRLLLPPYAQLYATHDCVLQRLNELFVDCECVQVMEVRPTYRLYHFRRTHDEVQEQEHLEVIPTRLCFRDFTLFQLDEFLADLVTPEMLLEQEREQQHLAMLGELAAAAAAVGGAVGSIGGLSTLALLQEEYSNFVRLNSLKARQLQQLNVGRATMTPTKGDSRGQVTAKSSKQRNTIAAKNAPSPGTAVTKAKAGLPSHHALLQGYNLDDTRQEVAVKRSKYHFDEGTLELYEERWCAAHTNKNLLLRLHSSEVSVARNSRDHHATARNVLVRTLRNLSVRVYNAADECAKVLIHYPNGLSVYHHNNYAEQLWLTAESVQGERKRVFTPHGAVIVHYKTADVILVMRYNGEVYRLYQYEFPGPDEEEEVADNLNDDAIAARIESADDASRTIGRAQRRKQSTRETTNMPPTTSSDGVGTLEDLSSVVSVRTQLLHLIADELHFLQMLMDEYKELAYLHLIVTTSQGQRVNITHKGRIYMGTTLQLVEWHDYFADESYAMRSDDVRMVWTAMQLKCYHADGTVLCTEVDEQIVQPFGDAEIDKLISASSSHENVPVSSTSSSDNNMIINNMQTKTVHISHVRDSVAPVKQSKTHRSHHKADIFDLGEWVCEGEEESGETGDPKYVLYSCGSCSMQHAYYATVLVRQWRDGDDELKITIDLYAADDISVQMDMPLQPDDDDEAQPEFEASEDEQQETRCIRVSIGSALALCVTDVACNINVLLKRYYGDDETTAMSEHLQLCVDFENELSANFHALVAAISKFKNYQTPKMEDIFFLERVKPDCSAQGFEFMTALKPPPLLHLAIGNTRTDINKLETVDDVCRNVMPWRECDLKKFPRFQPRRRQHRRHRQLVDIPMIMDVRTLDHFRRPIIELYARILWSRKNWKCKLEEHQRRLFIEQQRKTLYFAMLRYKVYPKYHRFMEEFRGHAKYIAFFDFMAQRCEDKDYVLPSERKSEESTRARVKSVLFGTVH